MIVSMNIPEDSHTLSTFSDDSGAGGNIMDESLAIHFGIERFPP